MKTKILILITGTLLFGSAKAQTLISTNATLAATPDPSSALHVADDKRGVLLPQVYLTSATDNVTVPTPTQGLLVQNTNSNKSNFWAANKWNRNFEVSDGLAIIKQTENFTGKSTASTTITGFPAIVPLFNLNDSTTGWTDLNATSNMTITKLTNTTYIVAEGMAQIDNITATDQKFQFAIGIFVNGQLKMASKYYTTTSEFVCSWRKFNLSGVINNLPVGTHTVKVYGRNLPKDTSGYTHIVYGGNTTNCSNINNDMARIFVTAQTTQ